MCGLATAGGLDVNPTRIDLAPDRNQAMVTVRNNSAEPVVIQSQVAGWTQVGGDDLYVPSRDILVSPPLATIPPGGSQIVRMAVRRDRPVDRALAYRLFVEELPPPPKPGASALAVTLRLGIPVFVASAKGDARPVLRFSGTRLARNRVVVVLQNDGNAHVRITEIALSSRTDAPPVAAHSELVYVHPGQKRVWTLSMEGEVPGNLPLRIKATTDGPVVDEILATAND